MSTSNVTGMVIVPSPFSAAIFICPFERDSRTARVPDPTNSRATAMPSARSPPAVFRTSIIKRVAPPLASVAMCERSLLAGAAAERRHANVPDAATLLAALDVDRLRRFARQLDDMGLGCAAAANDGELDLRTRGACEEALPLERRHVARGARIEQPDEIAGPDARFRGGRVVARRDDAQIGLMRQRDADVGRRPSDRSQPAAPAPA